MEKYLSINIYIYSSGKRTTRKYAMKIISDKFIFKISIEITFVKLVLYKNDALNKTSTV